MTRVSIVTPCYQAGAFISSLLESVSAQSFADWEQIVVDDGSTDGSAELVLAHQRCEPRLKLLRQANSGVIAARNRGFAVSDPESDYVFFLDADDLLKPDMLARLVDYLDDRPEVSMVYCEPDWIDADGLPVKYGSPGTRYVPSRRGVRLLPADEPVTPFSALFFWGRISPSISLLRRSALLRAGAFDEEQGLYGEDLDLWLRVALRGTIHYLPERLVLRRIHASNNGRRANIPLQESRLYRRWLTAAWLTADEKLMVNEVWRLRQGRLLPRLWWEWGGDHLSRGELVQAVACYLRSWKRAATYGRARLQRRLPAGPVW